jgi:hypothetical protein
VAQELCRCLVHPVGVLDDEEGSSADDSAEEFGSHLLEAHAAEPALQPRDLCGLGDLDPDQHAKQRQPARELRGEAEYAVAQGLLDYLRVGGRIEAEQRAHRLMEGEVRRGGLVLLADQLDRSEVVRLRPHFLDQPRFADAGLADELDEPPRTAARDVERMTEDRELPVASHERRGGAPASVPALERTELERGDRLGLTLEREGADGERLELRRGTGKGRFGDEHAADRRLAHDPRGRVDRVALDRVGAPVGRAEVAREHATAVDPDADRDPAAGVDDLPDRPEHALLVVSGRSGSSRDQHHLATVPADVRLEKRHTVASRCVLNRGDELVHPLGDRIRALALE